MFVLVLIRGCVRLSQLGKGEIKMTNSDSIQFYADKISSMLSEFEKTSYTDAQSDELMSTLIRVCQELRMTGERL